MQVVNYFFQLNYKICKNYRLQIFCIVGALISFVDLLRIEVKDYDVSVIITNLFGA